jgi:uncharacterized protein YecT (DUF1311 family)
MRLAWLALAIAFPWTLPAQTAALGSCDSATTTADIRRCAAREYAQAKRDLKRYVADARRLATKPRLLDSAQAVWERFRDLACRAAGSQSDDAHTQPVVVLTCLVDATRKRAHEVYNDFLKQARSALPEPQ